MQNDKRKETVNSVVNCLHGLPYCEALGILHYAEYLLTKVAVVNSASDSQESLHMRQDSLQRT